MISNKGKGRMPYGIGCFCNKCGNRGYIRIPIPADAEKFDELFDKFDFPGTLSDEQCRDKALDQCRCDKFYCPDCEMGLAYKDKFPVYKGKY